MHSFNALHLYQLFFVILHLKTMKRYRLLAACALALLFSALFTPKTAAFSLKLDSIAEWGKFPRFCVNAYRWGDKFFNGYDSTYVAATGHKFSARVTTESWLDGYHFELPGKKYIFMDSKPSTSIGLHLNYLAVSIGYDVNVNKLLTGVDHSRQRLRVGFNCMLFGAEAYLIHNNLGNTIKYFGSRDAEGRVNLPFNGINNTTWGIDAYYFFTHKRYSESAAFSFGRIQKRSHGSFYTGISIYAQNLDFDFSELPVDLRNQLPDYWNDYRYTVDTQNYAIRVGYGYNWVFKPNWVFGVSESPIIGLRKGVIAAWKEKVSFSLYNRFKASIVWNKGHCFFGAIGKFDVAIINDRQTIYTSGLISGELVFGYRFDLW